MPKEEYTERVEIVPCDDGWPGYEETMVELLKFYKLQKDMSGQIEVKLGWKTIFCLELIEQLRTEKNYPRKNDKKKIVCWELLKERWILWKC